MRRMKCKAEEEAADKDGARAKEQGPASVEEEAQVPVVDREAAWAPAVAVVDKAVAAWVRLDHAYAPSADSAFPTTGGCLASMSGARSAAWPSSARARPIMKRSQSAAATRATMKRRVDHAWRRQKRTDG